MKSKALLLLLCFAITTIYVYSQNDRVAIGRDCEADNMISDNWGGMKKSLTTPCYTKGTLKTEQEKEFLQHNEQSQSSEWSGTGFALNNGYIVTNYHVVQNAKSIIVHGVKGDFTNGFFAEVVATDKISDLALIKITDSRFSGFGVVPYKVKTNVSEVGEEIFVLGYPMTSTMGDEIKLTTGVISSKTGFQGDVSLYQISAPIQPGNSGGPLFDNKGNIVGIVCAKHTGAENVGYAIKSSYLKNLSESAISSSILPINNTISTQPLTGKVKSVKNFVFMIECFSYTISANNSSSATAGISGNRWSMQNRTIDRPSVVDCPRGLSVQQVLLTKECTTIALEVDGSICDGICIDREMKIVANGQSYGLLSVSGVAYSPYKTYTYGKNIRFSLSFESIPESTTRINIIEDNKNGIKIFGIELK